ncbi:MAG: OmpA family protein [Acidobacteriota bacterium]
MELALDPTVELVPRLMRRSNPWPAFADLFAALMIVSFGGLMLLSASYQKRVEQEVVVSELRRVTDEIHHKLRLAVGRQPGLKSVIRPCGEDTCVDLYIHFARNENVIAVSSELQAIRQLGLDLRRGLDELGTLDRRDVEIIVEGHADRSQVLRVPDRAAFLYNWNLSAQRASSVVYEFRSTAQLQVPEYKIVAIGYADSQPLCVELTDQCEEMNRRTTLRLRVDTLSVEKRLQHPVLK